MINILMNPSQEVLIGLMCLAAFRIYLEIIGLKFDSLPISKLLAKASNQQQIERFHRMGLVFSIGFIVLFAPQMIMGL